MSFWRTRWWKFICLGVESTDENEDMECHSGEQDGESYNSVGFACTDEDENMECHNGELHSSNTGSNRSSLQVSQRFICTN